MPEHRTGTREEWLAARRRLALPWVPVEKDYLFDTDSGPKTLAELFEGRSQLLVYHFMFGPDWEEGCASCSLSADHFDGPMVHLNERDVTFVCISRAPLEKLNAYKRRMGWEFTWVSSLGSDFNFDYGVSFTEEQRANGGEYNFAPIAQPPEELPGMSAFALEGGVVYHTYSCYARGGDVLMGIYQLLDRAPLGRNEEGLPWSMAWVRRHDEYELQPT